jgi:adenylate kinase family enzyme
MVVGTPGAGKTCFAAAFARRTGCVHIELDAINWQANWRDLLTHDPDEFKRRTGEAVAAHSWVCDGNYSFVRPIVLARATHLVWLDYERAVIMRRVVWRSIVRAISRQKLFGGNRESALRWFSREHPIRWAWDTFHGNRRRYEELFDGPAHAHVEVVRLRHPREADGVLMRLVRQGADDAKS